jgi:hypothetical protein
LRRPTLGTAAPPRARHFHHDPELRRRAELAVPPRPAKPRGASEAQRVHQAVKQLKPAPRPSGLRNAIEENLLFISSMLLFVGALGWCLLLYSEFRQSGLFATAPAST